MIYQFLGIIFNKTLYLFFQMSLNLSHKGDK